MTGIEQSEDRLSPLRDKYATCVKGLEALTAKRAMVFKLTQEGLCSEEARDHFESTSQQFLSALREKLDIEMEILKWYEANAPTSRLYLSQLISVRQTIAHLNYVEVNTAYLCGGENLEEELAKIGLVLETINEVQQDVLMAITTHQPKK